MNPNPVHLGMKLGFALLALFLTGCGTKLTFRYEPPFGVSVETQMVPMYATQPMEAKGMK